MILLTMTQRVLLLLTLTSPIHLVLVMETDTMLVEAVQQVLDKLMHDAKDLLGEDIGGLAQRRELDPDQRTQLLHVFEQVALTLQLHGRQHLTHHLPYFSLNMAPYFSDARRC